jgi:hypothetical protein
MNAQIVTLEDDSELILNKLYKLDYWAPPRVHEKAI